MITILKDFGKYHQLLFCSFSKPFENDLTSHISRRYDISNHDKMFWWSLRARVGGFPCSNENMWVWNRNKDKNDNHSWVLHKTCFELPLCWILVLKFPWPNYNNKWICGNLWKVFMPTKRRQVGHGFSTLLVNKIYKLNSCSSLMHS